LKWLSSHRSNVKVENKRCTLKQTAPAQLNKSLCMVRQQIQDEKKKMLRSIVTFDCCCHFNSVSLSVLHCQHGVVNRMKNWRVKSASSLVTIEYCSIFHSKEHVIFLFLSFRKKEHELVVVLFVYVVTADNWKRARVFESNHDNLNRSSRNENAKHQIWY
jgi:hypothetical protein